MIYPVLRRYWPPESHIQLLIAAIGERQAAQKAWTEWEAENKLDHASWAEIRLHAVAAPRIREFNPASPWLRRLQGVRRLVWVTSQMSMNAASPLVAAMCDAGIRIMLLKGAARIARNEKTAADRQMRDVDVLIHPDDWKMALDLANKNGWQNSVWPTLTSQIFPHHHSIDISDRSGRTIDLHHSALFISRNFNDDDAMWRRARPATFREIEVLAPSPADEMMMAIAHGLLYDADRVPYWVLDIASLIRSGEVDWGVLESETKQREIDPYIASGLLLTVERLNMPVPQAMLDRMIARVREPFITEFRSFATCYTPSEPWIVDRVRAAAVLRALGSARREQQKGASALWSRAWRCARKTKHPSSMKWRSRGSGVARIVPNWARAIWPRTPSRPSLSRTLHFKQISAEQPVSFVLPTGLLPDAYLLLHVTYQAAEAPVGSRPFLDIAAPGLLLKRSRTVDGQQSCNVIVGMPAALFTMRRIEHIELRAEGPQVAIPFANIRVSILSTSLQSHTQIFRLFDPTWYLHRQPALGATDADLLWEYLEAGWLDGRNPGPDFDANAYLCRNRDVARVGINPLLHYVWYGVHEGRAPSPVRVTKADTRLVAQSGHLGAADRHLVTGWGDADFPPDESQEGIPTENDPIDDLMRSGLSFPYDDRFWCAAADFLETRAVHSDSILAPDIFWWRIQKIHRYINVRLRPYLQYDWIVLHKGRIDELPPLFIVKAFSALIPLFANEVFVILGRGRREEAINARDPHLLSLTHQLPCLPTAMLKDR